MSPTRRIMVLLRRPWLCTCMRAGKAGITLLDFLEITFTENIYCMICKDVSWLKRKKERKKIWPQNQQSRHNVVSPVINCLNVRWVTNKFVFKLGYTTCDCVLLCSCWKIILVLSLKIILFVFLSFKSVSVTLVCFRKTMNTWGSCVK